jgi:hypothetical protein
VYFGLGMHQSKMSGDGDKEAYKKNTWKALIGMRLNSNWSMEGQYANFAGEYNRNRTNKIMLLSNTHTIAQILSINTIHIDNVTFRDVCTDTRKRMDGALAILLSASCVFSTTKVGKLDSTFLLTSSATAPIFCACFT